MAEIKDPENTIIMTLKDGEVIIQLLPDVAPKHSERMKTLARAGAYDNVVFHRVIDGFMAQTGRCGQRQRRQGFQPAPRRHRRVGHARCSGRVLEAAACAWHDRGGPVAKPEFGEFTVFHQLQRQ